MGDLRKMNEIAERKIAESEKARNQKLKLAEKPPTKKELAGCGLFLLIFMAAGLFFAYTKDTEKESVVVTEVENSQTPVKAEEPVYNELQKLFFSLSFNTSATHIENFLAANPQLKFTREGYNGTPNETTYRIAYTESVSQQRYGASGEHLSISFNQWDGSFMYAEYGDADFNETILYNYGIYWDLRENAPNNRYSGYYFRKIDGKDEGMEITYPNGYTTKTNFYPCKDAKSAMARLMSNSR